MFTAECLFLTVPNWKETRCPSVGGQVSKLWHNYDMNYCFAIKRNKLLTYIKSRMNLQRIVPSEKVIPKSYMLYVPH